MTWVQRLIGWSLPLLLTLMPVSAAVAAADADPLPRLFDRALLLSRAGDPQGALPIWDHG